MVLPNVLNINVSQKLSSSVKTEYYFCKTIVCERPASKKVLSLIIVLIPGLSPARMFPYIDTSFSSFL